MCFPSGCFSFHPQVRWYQTSDSVIVTVKLINPESQRYDFYQDRVIYRSVRSRPPVIMHSLHITSSIQWGFLSRALYTGKVTPLCGLSTYKHEFKPWPRKILVSVR